MIKEIKFSIIGFICLLMFFTFPTTAWFWEQQSNIITGTHVSLGNSSCTALECDSVTIQFGLPVGMEKPQYLKMWIYPECFSNMPTGNETYNLSIRCYDGYNKTIDMLPATCNPAESIIEWISIIQTNRTTAYYEFEGILYEAYWCIFERPSYNLERLPTEFNLVVDSMGLTNPQEEDVIYKQRVTGSNIMSGIGTILSVNFNMLQILFYLMVAISIVIAFVILIGGIPLIMKYVFKKITK